MVVTQTVCSHEESTTEHVPHVGQQYTVKHHVEKAEVTIAAEQYYFKQMSSTKLFTQRWDKTQGKIEKHMWSAKAQLVKG